MVNTDRIDDFVGPLTLSRRTAPSSLPCFLFSFKPTSYSFSDPLLAYQDHQPIVHDYDRYLHIKGLSSNEAELCDAEATATGHCVSLAQW